MISPQSATAAYIDRLTENLVLAESHLSAAHSFSSLLSSTPKLAESIADALTSCQLALAVSYKVTDPTNPPASIPQVTESEYNTRSGIYEGGIRSLKLTGLAFDMTRERFTTLGKQAKAFGAGIRAAKEFEIVKGDYLDWQNQLQITEQKSIALGVSEHKTTNDRSKAVQDNATSDEKLKQAEIGAELAREQTRQKQNQLDEFKSQLGELAKSK